MVMVRLQSGVFPFVGLSSSAFMEFTDVELFCLEGKFHLHRLVLASMSPYFKALLSPPANFGRSRKSGGGARETALGGPVEIILPDVRAVILRVVLEYIYTGRATVPRGQINEVLQLAQRLRIKGIARQLKQLEPVQKTKEMSQEERVAESIKAVILNHAVAGEEIDEESSTVSSSEGEEESNNNYEDGEGFEIIVMNNNYNDKAEEIEFKPKSPAKEAEISELSPPRPQRVQHQPARQSLHNEIQPLTRSPSKIMMARFPHPGGAFRKRKPEKVGKRGIIMNCHRMMIDGMQQASERQRKITAAAAAVVREETAVAASSSTTTDQQQSAAIPQPIPVRLLHQSLPAASEEEVRLSVVEEIGQHGVLPEILAKSHRFGVGCGSGGNAGKSNESAANDTSLLREEAPRLGRKRRGGAAARAFGIRKDPQAVRKRPPKYVTLNRRRCDFPPPYYSCSGQKYKQQEHYQYEHYIQQLQEEQRKQKHKQRQQEQNQQSQPESYVYPLQQFQRNIEVPSASFHTESQQPFEPSYQELGESQLAKGDLIQEALLEAVGISLKNEFQNDGNSNDAVGKQQQPPLFHVPVEKNHFETPVDLPQLEPPSAPEKPAADDSIQDQQILSPQTTESILASLDLANLEPGNYLIYSEEGQESNNNGEDKQQEQSKKMPSSYPGENLSAAAFVNQIMNDHSDTMGRNVYPCSVCGRVFGTDVDAHNHYVQAHPQQNHEQQYSNFLETPALNTSAVVVTEAHSLALDNDVLEFGSGESGNPAEMNAAEIYTKFLAGENTF